MHFKYIIEPLKILLQLLDVSIADLYSEKVLLSQMNAGSLSLNYWDTYWNEVVTKLLPSWFRGHDKSKHLLSNMSILSSSVEPHFVTQSFC